MGKSAATKQLNKANTDKADFLNKIDSFEYGQQRQGLENPFADVTNPFANLQNPFAGSRVATGAAEFQREANQESFASILDAQVQGGGGAGNNATALARAAAQSNQQISAGLSQQQQQIQQQTAQGQLQVDQLRGQGEQRRQELVGSGKQYVLGLSEQRDVGELQGLGNLYAGANESANAALKAKAESKAAIIGGIATIAGAVLTGGASAAAGGATKGVSSIFGSDRRLKENINFVRRSPSGLNVYHFNYIGRRGTFEGVMSDEVPAIARIKNYLGGSFDGVDYSLIDVNHKKL